MLGMIYVLRFIVLVNISMMVHTTRDMCIRTRLNQPYHMHTLLQLKLYIGSSHASTTHEVSKPLSFHTNTMCVIDCHVTIYTLFYNKNSVNGHHSRYGHSDWSHASHYTLTVRHTIKCTSTLCNGTITPKCA